LPIEHTWPLPQALPHLPQLSGSVLKFVQNADAPEPHAFGRAAGQEHFEPEHCWPSGHALPHLPQLFTSLLTVAQ
jgi:hypothetical protein